MAKSKSSDYKRKIRQRRQRQKNLNRTLAAEAGQCAFDQGKFWEYHDYLYEQGRLLNVVDLKTYAREIGLDSTQFNQCLDSGQNKAKIDRNLEQAYRLGLPGTPSFVVNDQKLAGPPTYATLKGIIDDILAAKQ